jgi:hypothetical protein
MTLLDLEIATPYAHPSVAGARALAGVLAPRPHWSPADLRKVSRLFASRAADELHRVARFDPASRWRLQLARTGGVEVWLETWTPGQSGVGAGPGAASAYTVLDGELTETWPGGAGLRRARRRPGRGAAAGPDRPHTLHNLGLLPAISVHAYAPRPR